MDIVERLYQLQLAKSDPAYRIKYKQIPVVDRSHLSRMFKALEWAFKHGKSSRLEAGQYFDDYFPNPSDREVINRAFNLVYL